MSDVKIKITADNQASAVIKKVDADIRKGTAGWRGKFDNFAGQVRGMFGGGPIQNALGGLLQKIGPIGAAVAGLTAIIGAATKKAAEFAASIVDNANASGLSFRGYQKLTYAALENGVSVEQLNTALNALQRTQNNIANDKGAQKAFERLGISIDEVAVLNPDQLLKRIAQGFKQTGDISALYEVLGKQAGSMKALLGDIAQAGDLGGTAQTLVVSEKALAALDKLGDGWDNVKQRAKSALTEIAGTAVAKFMDIKSFWNKVFSGQGMAKAADTMGQASQEAVNQANDAKQADEEAAAAARKRAVEELKIQNAKTDVKKDAEELDKRDKKRIEENADDQRRIALEQKRFEEQLAGLGRKRQGMFDPRGDMTAEQLQVEQANRILNTRADMNARRADRNAERKQKRLDALIERTDDQVARGVKVSKRGRLALEFRDRQDAMRAAQQNIDQRRKQADEAAVKALEIQDAMKARLDWVNWALQDQLVASQKQEVIQTRIDKNTSFLQTAVSMEGGE